MPTLRGILLVTAMAAILLAGVGCKAAIRAGTGAGARALSGGDIDCSGNNSPSIQWDEKPAIVNGRLAIRGTLVDDTRLHNPNHEVKSDAQVSAGQGFYLPAFSLIRLDSGDVSSVATIWPNWMRTQRLESAGGAGQVLYTSRYSASYSPGGDFSVSVLIPPALQEGEGQLLLLVWPRVLDVENPPEPIGVECL